MGPWVVHLFESEQVMMHHFLNELHKKAKGEGEKNSIYTNVWVLQYTEDVPDRAYMNWTCKSIPTKDANTEISTLPDFAKLQHMYQCMIKVGEGAREVYVQN